HQNPPSPTLPRIKTHTAATKGQRSCTWMRCISNLVAFPQFRPSPSSTMENSLNAATLLRPQQWGEPAQQTFPVGGVEFKQVIEFPACSLGVPQTEITPNQSLSDLEFGGVEANGLTTGVSRG